jgi:hypothetical protein
MLYADWLLQTKAIDDGISNRMRLETGSGANGLLTNTNRIATFYEGPIYTDPFARNAILGIPNAPPTTPTLFQTASTGDGFTLSWEGAVGSTVNSFTIDGVIRTPTVLTATTASWTGFASLSTHTVIMTAYNYLGTATSPPFVATVSIDPPQPPRSVTLVSSPTPYSFAVTWIGAEGATSYSFTLNGGPPPAEPVVDTDKRTAIFTLLLPGTSYSVVVLSVNTAGTAASDPFEVNTAIAPPSDVEFLTPPVEITSSGFTFEWSGGIGENVVYTFTLDFKPSSPSYDPITKRVTWTGLSSFTSYVVSIAAENSSGTSTSPYYDVDTAIAAPTQPVVDISAVASDGFTIVWTGADTATSYRFILNSQESIPYSFSVTEKTARWIDLSSSTQYSFAVFAINSTAPEGVSSGTYVVTTGPPAPTEPINITQTVTTSSGFTLTWEGGNYATQYEFTLDGAASVPFDVSGAGKYASWSGLDPDTDYNVVITAKNIEATVSSNVFVAATAFVPPTEPTGLITRDVTSSGFILTWSGGAGATSYTFPFTGIEPPPAPLSIDMMNKQATWINLTPSTSYTVFVTATDRPGSTTSSTGASVTTNPPVPTTPVPSQSGSTPDGFTLSWTGGTYATSYTFTLNGEDSTPESSSVSGKTATWTGLTVDTAYTVNITATNIEASTSSGSFSASTGPGAPTDISQSDTSSTGFMLSWTPGTGVTSYSFTIDGVPVTPTINGDTATFTGLSPDVTYSIVIISVKGGLSSPSAAFDATTGPPEPPTTPFIGISAVGYTTMSIVWSGGVGATSYSLVSNGVTYIPSVLGTNAASFVGLPGGTSQMYVFNAINDVGPTPSAPFSLQLFGRMQTFAGELDGPREVIVHPTSDEALLVANFNRGEIRQSVPGSSRSVIASGIPSACGLTVNIDGICYTIGQLTTTIYSTTLGGSVTPFTTLSVPTQAGFMANDLYGNLYVAMASSISKITPDGVEQPNIITGLSSPGQIYIDSSNGYLYVGSSGTNTINKYAGLPSSYTLVNTYSTGSFGVQGLYVQDSSNIIFGTGTSICLLDASSNISIIGQSPSPGFVGTPSLRYDGASRIYVSDTNNNRMMYMSTPLRPPPVAVIRQTAATATTVSIVWVNDGGMIQAGYRFELDGVQMFPAIRFALGRGATFTGLASNTSYSIVVITEINSLTTRSPPFIATTSA